MTRIGMMLSGWLPIQFAFLVGCSMDGSTVDESAKWGATETTSGAVKSTPPEPPEADLGTGITDQEIREQWASWCIGCGNDVRVWTRTAEDVMKGLAAAERAQRVFKVVTSAPLTSGEVDCLLKLIAATSDSKALGYIVTVYDAAEATARRKAASGESELYISNEINRIKAVAVESGGVLPGPDALAFVLRAAQDSSSIVRQAAAVALAKRSDFTNEDYVRSLRDSLDPAQRPAVDDVL